MTISFPVFNSEILYAGMDNPEKIKPIAGITGIWIEEATELNIDVFTEKYLGDAGSNKFWDFVIAAAENIKQAAERMKERDSFPKPKQE
ncbi:MAG TPA: hypothetical protein ENF81_10605 [Thermotogaceae bacterium]|nr:phage terminase large subunit [Thermotogota bacterium]HEW92970.1 hypothetical protein [Thermotogaceae bacterium]